MKQLIWVLLVPVLFFSCSKDNPNNRVDPNPTEGDIMMTVNGYAWAAPIGYFTRTGSAITVYGQQNQTSTINISISPFNGMQVYPLNGFTKIVFFDNGVEYSSITGQITVTSDDEYHIQGSFNGEVISNNAQSYQITNGSFNIAKQ
jgi:hypothetical protein